MSRLSNIDKSVSVIIPSCNDAAFGAQTPAMSFPEESGIMRYIKGNAQILHISFPHLTFPHIVDVLSAALPSSRMSDTRDITR